MVEAIIFDMDGVIVDTEPIQLQRQVDFLSHLNVEIPKKQINSFVGADKRMIWEIISQYINLDIFSSYQIYLEVMNAYHKNVIINYAELLNDGVVELLKRLKLDTNLKVGLASSGSRKKIDTVLKQCQIAKYFDFSISGDMFEKSKPNPEIYLRVAEKLEVLPENCIVVEDSHYGIDAGKRAGMYVIAKSEKRFNFSQESANVIIDEFDEVLSIIKKLSSIECDWSE